MIFLAILLIFIGLCLFVTGLGHAFHGSPDLRVSPWILAAALMWAAAYALASIPMMGPGS